MRIQTEYLGGNHLSFIIIYTDKALLTSESLGGGAWMYVWGDTVVHL